MKALFGSWMLLSLAAIAQVKSAPQNIAMYNFVAGDYLVELKISFLKPYIGQRLSFSSGIDTRKELCFSSGDGQTGPCIERFVGAAAVVQYSVRLANGRTPKLASIREHVTVPAQSPELPQRAPLSMTQKLIKGIGSDLQVFGYDEGPLKEADRIPTRK